MHERHRLQPHQLRWTCDPAKLGFETTAELPDLEGPIGQDRAARALDFGVHMPGDGYNVFVVGPVGTGRTSIARAILSEVAARQPPPGDWCYVHNFKQPNEPKALHLPPGRACQLRDDINELIEDVQREISAAFDSDEYVQRRDALTKEFREARQAELEAFEKRAQEAGLVVGRGPAGFVVAPAKDGEVMSPSEYQELPEQERQELDRRRREFQERLEEILRKYQRQEKQLRKRIKQLDQEVAQYAIGHLFDELLAKYADCDRVPEHLEELKADMVQHVDVLRSHDEDGPSLPIPLPVAREESRYESYRVNVLLTSDPNGGAPVVEEPNPTIDNLTGQIEHRTHMGALVTDYKMIRAGALHRANGGYLILEAEAVLRRPYAWEALKRALKNRRIKVESLQDQLRFLSTVTLEPEPIPLNVKVVLVGTPYLYYLMYAYDDDFRKLFKVKADFDTSTKRTSRTIQRYARFIASRCRQEQLPHFTAEAVARVIEHAARLASDQTRLSTRFLEVGDLVREAGYWARMDRADSVQACHVEKAIAEATRRSNRLEERIIELVDRGLILLNLTGEAVGQVNSLSVLSVGDYWFGRPTRVTATAHVGRSGVTQIDREAKLSGRLHDKGVLILSGFLGQRYGQRGPLTLAASLTFEQNYDLIEGDSASSAELYALLSCLSGVPIRQGIAVTGSVNQLGELQAIGGVNEKIEGFYATCKATKLTGEQGVLIPYANVQNLMLKQEVVEAVAQGRFHIYAVRTVDEGMEVLTGRKMGKRRPDGTYPPDTINRLVEDRLAEFAEAWNGRSSEADGNSGKGKPSDHANNNSGTQKAR